MTIEDNSEPYSVPMPDGSHVYAVRQKAPAHRPVMTLRGRTDGKIEILVDGRPLSDVGLLVQNLRVECDAAGGTTVRLECPFERVELDLSGPGTVFRRQTDGDQMRRVADAVARESCRDYRAETTQKLLDQFVEAEQRAGRASGHVSGSSVSNIVRAELERSKAVAERAAGVVKEFRQQQFYAPNLGEPHTVAETPDRSEVVAHISRQWFGTPDPRTVHSCNATDREISAPVIADTPVTIYPGVQEPLPPAAGTDPWRCTMPSRYPITDDAGNQVGWSDGSPFDAEGLAKALRDATPADDDGFEGPRIIEGSP